MFVHKGRKNSYRKERPLGVFFMSSSNDTRGVADKSARVIFFKVDERTISRARVPLWQNSGGKRRLGTYQKSFRRREKVREEEVYLRGRVTKKQENVVRLRMLKNLVLGRENGAQVLTPKGDAIELLRPRLVPIDEKDAKRVEDGPRRRGDVARKVVVESGPTQANVVVEKQGKGSQKGLVELRGLVAQFGRVGGMLDLEFEGVGIGRPDVDAGQEFVVAQGDDVVCEPERELGDGAAPRARAEGDFCAQLEGSVESGAAQEDPVEDLSFKGPDVATVAAGRFGVGWALVARSVAGRGGVVEDGQGVRMAEAGPGLD